MMKRTSLHRAFALGLALLLVVFALAGCARRNTVSLRIVSAYSGKGVPDATLTFTGSSGSESISSDATGTVSGQVQADRTQVDVEAIGYQKAFVQVADLTQLPATVQLSPLFLGAGMVTSGGQPVSGASVTVWNTTTMTGSTGTFTFEGLAEGTYVGRVMKQGYADATFDLIVGKDAKAAKVVLQEGQLLPLSSLAALPAYEVTASYHRTLGGEERSFDGRIIKNGSDTLVMSGDPANPTASLMVLGGTGYVFEHGTYVAKGETAAAAARILQESCEGLLGLPATFSPRLFTIEKQAQAQLLEQACDVWSMSGRFTFEGEAVTATATVSVGTTGTLTGVPVKIVLNARSQSFFDFVYDAAVEVVSVDQAQAAARFPVQ
ncbi:MAG: carboxypeptidase regulatory-like domain-containing protein [Caldiserica bacterium]|nr:carboxypeptidase regulatory-like domain-containing protein [Caldisericota bacterium]